MAEAAEAAGVGRRTVYQWREQDDEFAAEWDAVEDAQLDQVERAVIKRAQDKSDLAAIFVLRNRRPGRYNVDSRTTVHRLEGGPLVNIQLDSQAAESLGNLLRQRPAVAPGRPEIPVVTGNPPRAD